MNGSLRNIYGWFLFFKRLVLLHTYQYVPLPPIFQTFHRPCKDKNRLVFWLERLLKKTFKDLILYLFHPLSHQIFRPSTITTRTTLVKEMKVELWMQRRQFVFFLFFSFCYAARCLNIRFLSEIGVCGRTLNLKYHSWLSWPKYFKVSIKHPVL